MVNAAKAISARERSRQASLKFFEREKEREKVQRRYFEAVEAVDKVHAVRDREIAIAEARAMEAEESELRNADVAILELLALEVPRSELRERIGCTVADVKRAESRRAEVGASATVGGHDGQVQE